MLTPDEAATLAQITARDIYRRIEAGELHSIETDDGALRVCVSSLEQHHCRGVPPWAPPPVG
jgi:hypothetical protein